MEQLIADCAVISRKYIDFQTNDSSTANDAIWTFAVHRDREKGNVTKLYHAAVLATLLGLGASLAGKTNFKVYTLF